MMKNFIVADGFLLDKDLIMYAVVNKNLDDYNISIYLKESSSIDLSSDRVNKFVIRCETEWEVQQVMSKLAMNTDAMPVGKEKYTLLHNYFIIENKMASLEEKMNKILKLISPQKKSDK